MQFLLQDIQRSRLLIALLGGGHSSRLSGGRSGFWQGAFVYFLIRVERNSVNLHCYRRHHIRRFAVTDKGVEFVDIDLLVADDIGSDELTTVGIVESLHGSIFDTRELADDGFHLFEFDTEPADLHLSVASADELDVSVLAVVNDIASLIAS